MIIGLEALKGCIQDALDDLCSPRTSSEAKTGALERLEKQIAASCPMLRKTDENNESWDHFMALQSTFECNVPSRLLNWISVSTAKLEQAVNKDTKEEYTLASQLARSLCIIQGIVLTHSPSKAFLGRKYSLETILELFLASRHLTSYSDDDRASSVRNQQPANVPLSSTVLDTLLCILVDSPSALRVFESAHGVQAVVRILKRAGTPREVRMKCLEFLYFYLLDETGSSEIEGSIMSPPISPITSSSNMTSYPGTPSLQSTRTRLPKPLNLTPLRPLSRHGSASSATSSSSSSSRSTSSSSSHSFTSNSSLSTPASSTPTSPDKVKLDQASFRAHFHASQSISKAAPQPHRNTMMMLKREIEYVPLSPRKLGIVEGASTPSSRLRAQTHGQLHTPSRGHTHSSKLSISSIMAEDDLRCNTDARTRNQNYAHTSKSSISSISIGTYDWQDDGNEDTRKTTEQKKQFLGTMLGNVDALVEGVRKAGIWGLG